MSKNIRRQCASGVPRHQAIVDQDDREIGLSCAREDHVLSRWVSQSAAAGAVNNGTRTSRPGDADRCLHDRPALSDHGRIPPTLLLVEGYANSTFG